MIQTAWPAVILTLMVALALAAQPCTPERSNALLGEAHLSAILTVKALVNSGYNTTTTLVTQILIRVSIPFQVYLGKEITYPAKVNISPIALQMNVLINPSVSIVASNPNGTVVGSVSVCGAGFEALVGSLVCKLGDRDIMIGPGSTVTLNTTVIFVPDALNNLLNGRNYTKVRLFLKPSIENINVGGNKPTKYTVSVNYEPAEIYVFRVPSPTVTMVTTVTKTETVTTRTTNVLAVNVTRTHVSTLTTYVNKTETITSTNTMLETRTLTTYTTVTRTSYAVVTLTSTTTSTVTEKEVKVIADISRTLSSPAVSLAASLAILALTAATLIKTSRR